MVSSTDLWNRGNQNLTDYYFVKDTTLGCKNRDNHCGSECYIISLLLSSGLPNFYHSHLVTLISVILIKYKSIHKIMEIILFVVLELDICLFHVKKMYVMIIASLPHASTQRLICPHKIIVFLRLIKFYHLSV